MDVYLDNAASAHPRPEAVYAAVDQTLRRGASANRGAHGPGMAATRDLFGWREEIARFLGVSDSARLVFTAGATDSLNMALKGWLRPGDHVVVSDIEHNAVVRPLAALERRGVRVTRVPADAAGRIAPRTMLAAIEPETRLMVCTHASNVLGAVNPLEELGLETKRRGVPLLVDAAQTAGYVDIDAGAAGWGMLAVPGHKGLLGPPGVGLLYVREDLRLDTWREGGTGTESSRAEMPEDMPERLEAGTHNLPGIAGLAAGVQWLAGQPRRSVLARKREHIRHLLEALAVFPEVAILSAVEENDRANLVTFAVRGRNSEEVAGRLAAGGIAVRGGLHCAPGAHRRAGSLAGGAVRVSPGVFTSAADIEYFLDALRGII